MAKPQSPAPDTSTPAPPKFVVLLGRGTRGKTFWARWAIERAHAAGRQVVVADADRTNPTLSAYFDPVQKPDSADDRAVAQWLEDFIVQQMAERFTAVLDFGGGDLVLKGTARELELAPWLESKGIQPVAVHLIGPDIDDLAYLREVEAGVFAPRATILVLNEALVPAHRTPAAAFGATVEKHEILTEALNRGARLVFMPILKPAGEVDRRRQSFAAAMAGNEVPGHKPIGPIDRQRIVIWQREMETAFEPVSDMLP